MKATIKENIQRFGKETLLQDALALFNSLGYGSDKRVTLSDPTPKGFLSRFGKQFDKKEHQRAMTESWEEIQFLFQLTNAELATSNQLDLFATSEQFAESNFQSYIFISIKLKDESYTKTQLVAITRSINKIFMQPVIILFNYNHKLTLSVIDRRLHKKDRSKDVLEKVTLIKDIDIRKPHRAHIDILHELHLDNLSARSFDELHQKFKEVLNTKELNKKFYTDLSNWYFRALQEVSFPNDSADKNINETSLIRFISRILFSWFLKEKGLIPDEIFTQEFYHQQVIQDDDPKSSRYYQAVLQNLFFATLNTKIEDRDFLVESQKNRYNKQYMVFNKFRYKDYLNDPDSFIQYFENIPFLNGGLFDCLDHETDSGKRVCIDCFSNNSNFRKKLYFPDNLLFTATCCDFSKFYEGGTNNKDSVQVKGLFEIFNEYKFTIDENTPVDQEIALDPELLGQTLENLLAAFNPETETSARKETGSFYTPREIVDYMVDESMVAYLSNYLREKVDSLKDMAELEDVLRETFAYNEKAHPFDRNEVGHIVDAVFSMKVLDPACGSGAFPMGMLLKMVYVLNRIDPDNSIWREKLESQIPAEMKSYIEVNTDNYSRKLGLIWNCIYGIDIQPIAIQLSKLRFFISLVSEEIIDLENRKDNFGIIPLPNLENKFVCANSLLIIAEPEDSLPILLSEKEKAEYNLHISGANWNNVRELFLKKLVENRREYFTASSRAAKKVIKRKDNELRVKLSYALSQLGYEDGETSKIAKWDPFDPTISAEWFDPKLMFGIDDGFDIVIGNPPYVQLQKMSGTEIQKAYENQKYDSFAKTGDLYCLFYERGNQLLKDDGFLCYITSNKWMRAKYGEKLRHYFSTETFPLKIIDFAGYKVFESATVDTNIMLFQKKKVANHHLKACTIGTDYLKKGDLAQYFAENTYVIDNLNKESLIVASPEEMRIKEKIEKIGTPLKDWNVNINYGIKTGFNEAFIISGAKKDELIAQDPKSAEIIRPILRGRDIKRYRVEFADLWLINTHNGVRESNVPPIDISDYPAVKKHLDQYYDKLEKRQDKGVTPYNLRNCAYLEEFDRPKIVWKEISEESCFAFTTKNEMVANTGYIMTGDKIKYLFPILNSKLTSHYFSNFSSVNLSTKASRWLNQYVENIPIPKTSESIEQSFYNIVSKLDRMSNSEQVNSQIFFIIDLMVYKLYSLDINDITVIEPGFIKKINKIGLNKTSYQFKSIEEIANLWKLHR